MVKERDQIHEATWVNHHAIASAWLRTRLSFDRIRPSPNLMQGNNLKQYSLRSYLSRYHQAQRLAPAACECNATSVAGLPDHLFHPQLTTPNTRVDHITLTEGSQLEAGATTRTAGTYKCTDPHPGTFAHTDPVMDHAALSGCLVRRSQRQRDFQ